jgi:hypothetical protein
MHGDVMHSELDLSQYVRPGRVHLEAQYRSESFRPGNGADFSCRPTIGSVSGLSSEGAEWIEIGRGFESDAPDQHGGRRGKNSTSEVYIRNMFEAWLGSMANGQAAGARAA